MEVTYHHWVGVRSSHRTQNVVRTLHIRHPVPDGFGGGILQRSRPRVNSPDLCSHEPHAKHIELLPFHVLGTHVHDALQPKASTDGGGSHAMLSSTSLGNDALFSDTFGQKGLSHRIVDLVSTSVVQVFSFEVDIRSFSILAVMLRELFSKVQRGLPSHVVFENVLQLLLEVYIRGDFFVGGFQFFQCCNQRFWHVLSSEFSIPSCGVWPLVRVHATFPTCRSALTPARGAPFRLRLPSCANRGVALASSPKAA
mmetsp:Transcript_4781/g.30268  ORF Transcript_4781/g.30268 Transcript_4781/m.30268 type:complete len:254 (+) Transcript_4781:3097-3858(+)